jgi:hypothetical protein
MRYSIIKVFSNMLLNTSVAESVDLPKKNSAHSMSSLPFQNNDQYTRQPYADQIYPDIGELPLATRDKELVQFVGEGVGERENSGEEDRYVCAYLGNMKSEPVENETAQNKILKHMRALALKEFPERKRYRFRRTIHRREPENDTHPDNEHNRSKEPTSIGRKHTTMMRDRSTSESCPWSSEATEKEYKTEAKSKASYQENPQTRHSCHGSALPYGLI